MSTQQYQPQQPNMIPQRNNSGAPFVSGPNSNSNDNRGVQVRVFKHFILDKLNQLCCMYKSFV